MSPTRKVRTPASTSNLGPGFDFLGLALNLYLEVEWLGEAPAGEHCLERASGEARGWPEQDNLLLRAFDAALEHHRVPPRPSCFAVHSEIPVGRGLGSSGAAVAAGLWLGASLAGSEEPDLRALADLGLALEGHPDNSTASLFGGCTLAVPCAEGQLRVVRHPLCERLVFAVAWPDSTVPTEDARAALPEMVPFADAVENPRRLALLLEGLRRGDAELVRLGGEDRLHVAHRLELIPGARAALRAAREAGAWMSTISGSGSALIAVHDDPVTAERIARALGEALREEHAAVEERVLRATARGVELDYSEGGTLSS